MWRAAVISGLSVVLLLLYSAWAGTAALSAASLVDPRLGFRVLSTEHFQIYFHQGEEEAAARLSAIAEETWHRVSTSLASRAPRHTHVILADQTDLANGWATPLPRNVVFVTAAAPSGSEFIGRSQDWLRLVFTHEFTHIVHLDRSEGWMRVFRGIFGRAPIAFPNLFLPEWQIEGLASFEESAITGEGRLHAGDFRAIEREAARAGRLEPLDRINGGLTDWPNGLAAYAYGLGFHQYLVDRFGEPSLGELAKATAGRLPFFSSRSFRAVYGQSLGSLWRDYRAKLLAAVASEGPAVPADRATAPTRLTRHGNTVLGPRFAPACTGCPSEILYSVRTPDGFPSLRSVAVDGSQPRRLADRYLGSTLGAGAEVVVFDQQEWRRNTGLYSDVYTLDRRTGAVQQLTHESRIQDPDLSPDGRTIVGVREHRGDRELVLLPLQTRLTPGPEKPADTPSRRQAGLARTAGPATTLVSEPGTQFDAPRWSPDGRSIVAARQRLGALSEIVIVDGSTGTVRRVASDPSARIVTPTWRPDGRAIVAAADYDEGPFELYEYPVAEGAEGPAARRLTAQTGGASWPDVSADGNSIVYVGYTVDGFDLFTIPYPPTDVGGEASRASQSELAAAVPRVAPTPPVSRSYSALPTLLPTSWSPIVEIGSSQLRAGVTIAASDVLARHLYAASATWLVEAPRGAAPPDAAAPDWNLVYVYDRWRPAAFLSASSDTAFGAGAPDATGRPTSATLRSLALEGGILFPVRHVRATHRVLASVVRTTDRYTFSDHIESRSRTAARFGVATSTARTYGYSISREDGLSIGSTVEFAGRETSAVGGSTTITGDARVYLGGFAPHHVIALRAAAGVSDGEPGAARVFHLGGSGPSEEILDFGRQAISLLRGFPADAFAGTRVALLNTEYRFPIARPQRGIGTLPLLLHSVHAAMFADAGHAWIDEFSVHNAKIDAGGELACDVVAGYSLPLTIAIGAAWGHDGASAGGGGTVYLRLGHAF